MLPSPPHRLRYLCILVGGFLGPFAGQSLAVVLPEFAADFGITLTQASLTMTAYTFPFAAMLLFSSSLTRNLSPVLVARVAFVIIAVCAVILILSPTWWVFLAAYILAALCNAFTLPSLQLILTRITPAERLGAALGSYAAMQSFGLLSAPLFAGAVVSVASWRWIYLILVAVPLFIVLIGLPDAPPSRTPRGSFAVSWSFVRGCFTLLVVGLCTMGMGFVLALHVGELFAASPLARGFIVMVGGLSSFLFSSRVGGLADTRGPRPLIVVALLIAACGLLGIGLASSMVLVAVLWGIVVTAGQGVQVGVNLVTLRSSSGAQILSSVQAFRFFGSALTPVLILPLYSAHHTLGFGVAAGALVMAAGLNCRPR
ncbi:MFS transporter [Corynebacterium liangguodongii]|uniref:MFS transporter n=1 Tax=Corynebacterium liangguodongii TaxID=2079535 RepID=A0A2S0WGT3_9CORY|nr:MFS transporter [Corynebacterium liangguodongii]AWB84936.1 MFS transporter [Corynebacterium liangguodongii]PWB99356.1 MFS transporter [Corynebacterium liangguodongii]